ncbi:sugar phosphate isomerase/epimerase family protein [Amycolatopsis samaneae]|uniref:Sugar phosphate isomerase/epimerase family protein n=1 Tax=Amycolatopsis samaneae TaxID=664691 RepID=A0ABW5GP51_9PSEU
MTTNDRLPRFGYGTNGFANHRLSDALRVLADLGYEGVALTLDHHHLDPFAGNLPRRVAEIGALLDRLGLAVVVETGARFLLDPWRKHAPTLLDPDREHRIDFLSRAVRVTADLGAEAMSFWSGNKPPDLPDSLAWDHLVTGCAAVLDIAERHDVRLGFEPEPGMFVSDLASYDRLCTRLYSADRLGLTLDIGHCQCTEPLPVADCVRKAAPRLTYVQIDDMRRNVHEHLEFGAGEIDFPPVLAALAESGYGGLIAVELPRDSHRAPSLARDSIGFLRRAAGSADAP